MPFDGRLLSGVGVLHAVVESGNFARAAEALGLTASGVSRAVARLEARIGARLIDRTTRSLALTEEGRRFYERVRPCLDDIEEAAIAVAGAADTARGHVRVNIDPYLIRIALGGRLGAFLDAHPGLTLDLITRDQIGDLVGDGMDVAVRFGDPVNAALIVRKLADVAVLTVAAPAYLAAHGRPQAPDDLTRHECLQFRDPTTGRAYAWEFHRDGTVETVRTRGRIMVSDAGTLMAECLAGAGVAQILDIGADALFDSGQLQRLLPDWSGETFPLYALYSSRHPPSAKVRAFIDFVRSAVRQGT
jgi:DNA-binding transcriptional LysR family regulator